MGMEYAFKIGQQLYRHSARKRGGARTGPYVIVGMVRQSDLVLYRVKSPAGELLVDGAKLRLALQPRDKS
jgi:hypothetical protein